MLAHAKCRKLHEIPISCIEPEGWLRRYLERQRDGLTGHMEAAGYPFDTDAWACPKVPMKTGEGWWPYEQTGYWIDGMVRCGHLLGDGFLIERASKQIEYVLSHADADGYLGPKHVKKPEHCNRWGHAVFFRALMAHHSATGDERIPAALRKHYLSGTSPHSMSREVCNVEAILWAYSRTGDGRLLDHAVRAHEGFDRASSGSDMSVKSLLSDRVSTEHGVSFMEMSKIPAIVYMYTGRKRLLDATVNGFRKLDRDSMLVDGVPSSSEHLAGRTPLDCHETCDIADYTWSAGFLLMATGAGEWADRIERACLNAAPGAVRSDFRALQYFSCPNQVLATGTSDHTVFQRGGAWMSYRPNPGTECCPGEVNRIMPNYAARMWMSDGKDGLVAALYGPSRVTAEVGGKGERVTVIEETDYPFGERVDFQILTQGEVRFPLHVRVPGWCRAARILVNGEPAGGPKPKPGQFVKVERAFRNNDRVTVVLPMELALSRWPGGGVAVERGPLVYSLKIDEDWRVAKAPGKSTKQFPAWDLLPASEWNYALALNEKTLTRDVEIVRGEMSPEPWSIDAAPVMLRVPARKVRGWKVARSKRITRGHPGQETELHGEFALTPPLPSPKEMRGRLGKVETVTLVPYGCTHLRLTIFPCAKS
jgi:hypothetical protein